MDLKDLVLGTSSIPLAPRLGPSRPSAATLAYSERGLWPFGFPQRLLYFVYATKGGFDDDTSNEL